MALVLLGISCVGGFISGLLGVGGAVVLIPLLLSVPPLLGIGELEIHTVSGITMLQVFVTSALGAFIHGRGGNLHPGGVVAVGIPLAACALLGAVISKYVHADVLLITFGILVLLPFVLLPPQRHERIPPRVEEFSPHRGGCIGVGSSVGLISGLIGAGGGFILVPLLVTLLKFPLKMAIGSSLGVVFIGALFGTVGKIATQQVVWAYALPVLLGSVPMVHLGSMLCRKLSSRRIRHLFLGLLAIVGLHTWIEILLRLR
ncbi:MAG: sulfite exporter TauE/SafE family protein [Desulfuromonadaceae bacterium]|nr:sulfite exporter TauE/SafE family protein [Geobacteraceae bacterium]